MGKFEDVMSILTVVLLILSVIGSLFTIITFTLFGSIRTYPIKLIMYLCVTIFVGHLAFAINFRGVTLGTRACAPVAAIVHYAFLCNFFWCFCIAFNFYQMIVKRNSGTRSFEKYYHFIGWGIPCIGVIGVAATHNYGQTVDGYVDDLYRGTCYIQSGLAIFLSFFLPGLIIVSANTVLFFFVASEIHTTLMRAPETEQQEKTKEFRVLISIFVTIGLSWIFGFLYAILSFTKVKVLVDIFLVLFTIATPLQGFFIFAAYCLNKKVFYRWRNFFGKCIPCCKVTVESTSSSATASTRGASTASTSSRSMSSKM
eukprot:TRINITY_DN8586_c0_g1_i3.p1 TRINITY_DN8586_c0_g1~~TRINITY_DN8586_c0_g1_i3.p1  ORF type:complete len:313 (+),score=19.07 TRINITY_DN8586_c0_g1_i3:61-999(+)